MTDGKLIRCEECRGGGRVLSLYGEKVRCPACEGDGQILEPGSTLAERRAHAARVWGAAAELTWQANRYTGLPVLAKMAAYRIVLNAGFKTYRRLGGRSLTQFRKLTAEAGLRHNACRSLW